MTIPGLGGQTPQRPDQAYAGTQGQAVAPGSPAVVRARLVIISGANGGLFVYSPSPGAGNLIASIAAMAGTDQFGNSYVEGVATYVTIAGTIYALEVGSQTGSGTAFLVHNLTSPPNSDPLFSAIQASPAGCVAAVQSGKSTAGSSQAAVDVADSTASGFAGGQVEVIAGQTTIDGNMTVGGRLTITAANSLFTGDVNLQPPMATPPHYVLPTDNNIGSSWATGERQFINNCVDAINSIIASMTNRGFF